MKNCIICKTVPDRRSYSTSERLRSSQFLIIFKLFDILKIECDDEGRLCEDCYMLLDKIDCLGNELQEKTEELKSRLSPLIPQGSTYFSSYNPPKKRKYDQISKPSCKLRESQETLGMRKPNIERVEHVNEQQTSLDTVLVTSEANNETQSGSSEVDASNDIDESVSVTGILMSETKEEPESDYEDNEVEQGSSSRKKQNPENVDYNVSYTKTNRGQDQLLYQDHLYHNHTCTKAGPTNGDYYARNSIRWRCIYYKRNGKRLGVACSGSISSSLDGSFVYLDTKVEHNHDPITDKIQWIKFRNRLRQIAIEHPHMGPTEVISFAQFDYPDGQVPFKLPVKEGIIRMIQKTRQAMGFSRGKLKKDAEEH